MAIENLSIKTIDAGKVHVGLQACSPCNKCSLNMGCGIGLMQLFRSHSSSVEKDSLALSLPSSLQDRLDTGDPVKIAITGKELIKISMLLYLLPLLCMFVVLGFIQSLAATLVIAESWIILAAILALSAGFALVHYFTGNISSVPLKMILTSERDSSNATNQ